MKNILARGGIEFLAVLLGITLSFNVDEWKQDKEIEKRLKSDYINIQKDLKKDIFSLYQSNCFSTKIISKWIESFRND